MFTACPAPLFLPNKDLTACWQKQMREETKSGKQAQKNIYKMTSVGLIFFKRQLMIRFKMNPIFSCHLDALQKGKKVKRLSFKDELYQL